MRINANSMRPVNTRRQIRTVIQTAAFSMFFISLGGIAAAQAADKRIEDIRHLYTQTNEAIAIADKEAPYTDIFVVEIAVNKAETSYPAVGTYSNLTKFYYTFGDREVEPYPDRLMKINAVTKRSASIINAEFLYDQAGRLVFGYVRTNGEEQRETRMYFASGQLIRMMDNEKQVNVKLRSVIETAAAFKRESARLSAIFRSALKEGF